MRKDGLKDYQKLSDESLKISLKQIKEEFNGLFSNSKRIMFIVEEDKQIKAYIIGTLINNAYQRITYTDDLFVRKDTRGRGFAKELMKIFKD